MYKLENLMNVKVTCKNEDSPSIFFGDVADIKETEEEFRFLLIGAGFTKRFKKDIYNYEIIDNSKKVKAVLVLDNIPEELFNEHLCVKYRLLYYPGREIKELGLIGKQELKPLPEKNKYDVEKYATVDYENNVTLGHYLNEGYNACLDDILGEK